MRHFRLSLLSLFTGLALISTAQDVNTITLGTNMNGDPLPVETTEGAKQDLRDFRGERGIIVIFSCNTCPFVVGNEDFAGWEKTYNNIYEKAQSMGISVVLMNSNEGKRTNEDSPLEMKKHADKMGYKMPYLLDPNSNIANLFGAKTTPHVFFFNENMELIYVGAIDNSYDAKRKIDENYLMDALESFINGNPLKLGSTPPRGCSIKRVKL